MVTFEEINRLYSARRLLFEAEAALRDSLAYRLIQGFAQLDLALEIFSSISCKKLGKFPGERAGLPQYLDTIISVIPDLSKHKSSIQELHLRRNRVQHGGSIPSHHDANQAIQDAYAYVTDLVLEVYGTNLNSLTPIMLIQEDKVKLCLERALDALDTQDFKASVRLAAEAFARAKSHLNRSSPFGPVLREPDDYARLLSQQLAAGIIRADVRQGRYSRDVRTVASGLKTSDFGLKQLFAGFPHLIAHSEFGLVVSEYRHFHLITPRVILMEAGNATTTWRGSLPYDREDSEFCIDFATRACLAFEAWLRTHSEMTKWSKQSRGGSDGLPG